MQADPIIPGLKAPENTRLTLYHDEPPPTFAFNFKLRRYTKARSKTAAAAAAAVAVKMPKKEVAAVRTGGCRLPHHTTC